MRKLFPLAVIAAFLCAQEARAAPIEPSGWQDAKSCAAMYYLLADNEGDSFDDPHYLAMRRVALRQSSFRDPARPNVEIKELADFIYAKYSGDGTITHEMLGMVLRCMNDYHVRPSDQVRDAFGETPERWNAYWAQTEATLAQNAEAAGRQAAAQNARASEDTAYAEYEDVLAQCTNPAFFDKSQMGGSYTSRDITVNRNLEMCNSALSSARDLAYRRKDQDRIRRYANFKFGVPGQ